MLQRVLIQHLSDQLFLGQLGRVCIDSREVQEGDLFIAMPGSRVHGNHFIESVLNIKNTVVIAEKSVEHPQDERVHGVSDPMAFLWQLGKKMRGLSHAKVIAITGSNGKTTTKDILSTILGEEPHLKTAGNFNNHIGVPLTLCQLKQEHRIAVIEVGTSAPGEIERLTALVRPHISILTAINRAHLSGLKSLKAIAMEKSDIFNAAPKALCLFKKSDLKHTDLKSSVEGRESICFDTDDDNEPIVGRSDTGILRWKFRGQAYCLASPAVHNTHNAMAAIRVALELGMKAVDINHRLSHWRPAKHRLCLLNWKKRKILDDCYNANPASFHAALDTAIHLRRTDHQKVFVILGDMKELGSKAKAMHRECGDAMARLGVDVLLTLGELSREAMLAFDKRGGSYFKHCESAEELASYLKTMSRPHDILLLKGSRSMHLETVLDSLDRVKPYTQKAVC